MSIITISNQYGSCVEEVADKIGEMNGFHVIKKAEIEEKLRGVVGGFLAEKFLSEREPTFLDKYLYDMNLWKNLISETILFFAKEENIIILGRGGALILNKVPGSLHLLIVGEKAERIKYTADKENITSLQAEEKIDRIDGLKQGFWKYHFGTDWPDPAIFDITFNPLKVGIELCAELGSSISRSLSLSAGSRKKKKNEIERRHIEISTGSIITLSTGLSNTLFDVSVKKDKKIKVRFYDVPADLRKKALKAVAESHKDYTVKSII